MKKHQICWLIASALYVLPFSIYSHGSPGQLEGMSMEIVVKAAKELKIKAPSGDHVAVLDQDAPSKVEGASPSQDHHNGWLQLNTEKVVGDTVQVKGKYYLPTETTAVPTGLRFTVRQRDTSGLIVYSDKTLDINGEGGKWVDFVIALPINKSVTPGTGPLYLLLSAVPFAGPLYLANLEVTDPQGNQLWQFPEFEEQ